MTTTHMTIAEQALELTDGLQDLLDVAFAHDLAVAFVDVGSHDNAIEITSSLHELLVALLDEAERVDTLGQLGGLLGTLEPVTDALYELLLEAARLFNERATQAVIRTRRPVELALGHLRAAALFGARTPVPIEHRTALLLSLESLVTNLRSFGELLRVLDPIAPTLGASAPPPK